MYSHPDKQPLPDTLPLAPHITYEINHKGSVRLAELARKAGVQRFVYMSSCSVYGVSGGDPITLATAVMILGLAATLACLVPALRATRVNPITALRE